MSWDWLDIEIELYKKYMAVYIQLLPDSLMCCGLRIHKSQMPTFEYFKQTVNDNRYSLNYKRYFDDKENKYFDYYMGVKYYVV